MNRAAKETLKMNGQNKIQVLIWLVNVAFKFQR